MSRDFLRAAVAHLDHLDIQIAPDEAEQMCAQLAAQGIVDMVMTEDIDALVFGAPVCLRGITTLTPTVVRLSSILGELSLTRESFVDFCILCGSDFTPKAPGFGPVKSLAFIKQHGSFDSLVAHHPAKWPLELWAEFAETAPLAREKFLSSWPEAGSATKGAL
jgi:5'-3' exonuclease